MLRMLSYLLRIFHLFICLFPSRIHTEKFPSIFTFLLSWLFISVFINEADYIDKISPIFRLLCWPAINCGCCCFVVIGDRVLLCIPGCLEGVILCITLAKIIVGLYYSWLHYFSMCLFLFLIYYLLLFDWEYLELKA